MMEGSGTREENAGGELGDTAAPSNGERDPRPWMERMRGGAPEDLEGLSRVFGLPPFVVLGVAVVLMLVIGISGASNGNDPSRPIVAILFLSSFYVIIGAIMGMRGPK